MTRVAVHTTSSVAVDVLARYLRSLGEQSALERLGLRQALAPSTRVPVAVFRELWVLAAAHDPSIGLKVVWLFEPEQMHLVGHIVARCATLGDGLAEWARFARLVCACDVMTLTRGSQLATLTYQNVAPDCDMPWLAEHYACLVLAALRRLAATPQALRSVHFMHAPQVAMSVYRERLGCDVHFGATHNAVALSAQVLDQPMAKADPYLRHFLERQATDELERLNAALQRSTAHRVREALMVALQERRQPHLTAVAQQLTLTPAAVRKGLKADGTAFREVLDGARRDLARTWMARDVPLTTISDWLGYSEPAVLQRACRRWFGESAGSAKRAAQAITEAPLA